MPAKTCPNLSRLMEDAGPELLSGFLNFRAFEKLDWIKMYPVAPGNPEGIAHASEVLRQETKERLGLQAGKMAGSCLAANVLSPIIDHLEVDSVVMKLNSDNLRTAFRRSRRLASGGQTVEFTLRGEDEGTLSVPGKGTIDVKGRHRVLVIQRLVDAHNRGTAPVATTELKKGIEDQSLANIFGTDLWKKLKSGFVRQVGKGRWEIAI